MAQQKRQKQSREFEVSDLSSIPCLGKSKKSIKYLTRFQVPREGLFDMVVQEPEDNRRCGKILMISKQGGPRISKGFPTNLEH